MPELPEVETTRQVLIPWIVGNTVATVIVRERRLRSMLPHNFADLLEGQRLQKLTRRGKYLLFGFTNGTLLGHLGMSGSLLAVTPDTSVKTHDHVDFVFSNGIIVRYHDPRRFGSFHFTTTDPCSHPLLAHLGPEPLSELFDGAYLYAQACKTKTVAVKPFLMDSRTVVGVGNIYANESLFRAGIHPQRPAVTVSQVSYEKLALAVKEILTFAIQQRGTTLRDYRHGSGEVGSFRSYLRVYERAGESCFSCKETIQRVVLGQRSSYFCSRCQRER
jgi:formamidopyrimidine-DNA glycosylase